MQGTRIILGCFSLICSLCISTFGQTRFVARDALSIELGGKGFLYSFSYEHLETDNLGFTVGLSFVPRVLSAPSDERPLVSETGDTAIVTVPVFISWYPVGVRDRFFVDAGVDLLSLLKNRVMTFGTLGVLGFGYSYRPREDGMCVKVGPLLFFGAGGERSLKIHALPWFGISVGEVF